MQRYATFFRFAPPAPNTYNSQGLTWVTVRQIKARGWLVQLVWSFIVPCSFIVRYRCELKQGTLLTEMLPSIAAQTDLLDKFHSNHSRAMEVLASVNVYCFRWAMEVDLVASDTAASLLHGHLNVPLANRSKSELLVNQPNAVKKLETVLTVLRQLPKKNYPHSYSLIRKSLPKTIRSAV